MVDEFGCDAEIRYTGGEKGWTGNVPKMMLAINMITDKGWTPSMGSEEAVQETAAGVVAVVEEER